MTLRILNNHIEINGEPVAKFIIPDYQVRDAVDAIMGDSDDIENARSSGYNSGWDEAASDCECKLHDAKRAVEKIIDSLSLGDKPKKKILGAFDDL